MVVVQAVFFAKEIGLSTCILEGDSTKIFNASRSDFDSFASFRHLIPDAKFLQNLSIVFYFLILRE